MDGAYSWTAQYERSWDVIQEDQGGTLSLANAQLLSASPDMLEMLAIRQKWIHHSSNCQRGILRHVFLVLDMSLAMADKDFKPSYLELTCLLLKQFVQEFFDQNPISLLGIIITKDGIAQKVSELSGSPLGHFAALDGLKDSAMLKGEPSLMNSLDLGRVCLAHVPTRASREILLVISSLTSRDPGNILDAVERLKQDRISCSIVGLRAETHICKTITKETGGVYRVAMDEDHFKTLLWDRITPPPVKDENTACQILMGFPKRVLINSLCACHNNMTKEGYICPRCGSKQCHLPSDCSICEMKLISAPHLARSYHHLFPVFPFVEVTVDSSAVSCYGCSGAFNVKAQVTPETQPNSPVQNVKITLRIPKASSSNTLQPPPPSPMRSKTFTAYQCRKCNNLFCLACDVYIHEGLHACPGC